MNPSAPSSVAPRAFAPKVKRALRLVGREIIGIAQDFWKDGDWGLSAEPPRPAEYRRPQPPPKPDFIVRPSRKKKGPEIKLWHAIPGEISEIMWGEGAVAPLDEHITDLLIKPLSLTKDLSLLDLSAGLGARMRRTTDEFGTYIDGREPDPEIAARGMSLSIKEGLGKRAEIMPYDPSNFVEQHKYDCVVAREIIYRVPDKKKFVKSVVACCKPQVQISFTDYIVNPESKNRPAILAWLAYEKEATPLSLVGMAELWAKAGISLRVHDDQSELYKKEIKSGLLRFAKYVQALGLKPDAETKLKIEKRINLWALRLAAMEEGLLFYRFYGMR